MRWLPRDLGQMVASIGNLFGARASAPAAEKPLPHVMLLIFTCLHTATDYGRKRRDGREPFESTGHRYVPFMCQRCRAWTDSEEDPRKKAATKRMDTRKKAETKRMDSLNSLSTNG